MSKTDHGTVDVEIGSEIYTLNFNLKAVRSIERFFGGISPALAELQKFSLTAAAKVIIAGANLTLKPKEGDALEEAIYEQGVGEVTVPLITYVVALLNPAAKTEEELEKAAEAGAVKGKK
ncbi:hypothetical protein [Pseudomonas fluorescens]|uniref:Uncharacterized protein n=1 Tax=Pseudomonas fluorescens TaxID=294 RepID=A0A5E6ZDH3_PSEFL|nr:hypothetical protein [Pseudomonas fluorescens]VVN64490.1 hypothetical protein PS723_00003 [Pseudomonas fluorescens]